MPARVTVTTKQGTSHAQTFSRTSEANQWLVVQRDTPGVQSVGIACFDDRRTHPTAHDCGRAGCPHCPPVDTL